MKPFTTPLYILRLRMVLLVVCITTIFWWMEACFPLVSSIALVVIIMALYMVTLTAVLVVKRKVRQKKPLHWQGNATMASFVAEGLHYPFISVVVPAHNEERVLVQLVNNLMQLDYPNYDVLIMDDGSTDSTPAQLSKLTQQYQNNRVHLRWLRRQPSSRKGKSAVLNDARLGLKGEWLAVFDADAQVKPTFLKELVAYTHDSPNVAAVQARKVIANAGLNWWTKGQAREYLFDSYMQGCRDLGRSAVELRGNGLIIKTSVLDELGGWNEASVTDDLDMSTRLHLAGYDIRFAAETPVFEEGITNYPALLRQRTRWAEGSLVRYLEAGGVLLFSPVAANRVMADMLTYYVDFFFPVLIVIDVGLVVARLLLGQNNPPSFLLTLNVAPLFALAFIPALYTAFRRFERPSRWLSLGYAFETSLFIALVWVPNVFFAMWQLMTQNRKELKWLKTEHTGSAHVV